MLDELAAFQRDREQWQTAQADEKRQLAAERERFEASWKSQVGRRCAGMFDLRACITLLAWWQ